MFFFFNDTATTEIYTLSLHDALPICVCWNAADLEGLQTLPYRCDTLAVAVPAGHPLALRDSCSFSETLDCEHVGLPASTAVYTMLARAAAIIGRPINYRAVVSSFDATIR